MEKITITLKHERHTQQGRCSHSDRHEGKKASEDTAKSLVPPHAAMQARGRWVEGQAASTSLKLCPFYLHRYTSYISIFIYI